MTRRLGLLILPVLLAACAGVAPSPTPSPSPSPTPSPSPSPSPGAAAAFYLRAWISQALPPRETFTWAPQVTISEGILLDGNVAVPAIFPGPLMIPPFARTITDEGIATIIERAESLGLLGDVTDFTGGTTMPGSQTAQIEMIVDGASRTLIGDPNLISRCGAERCIAEPGTPEAFAAFWQDLVNAGTLLEAELGPAEQYQPERVALLLTAPSASDPSLAPVPVAWPFDTPLAEAGVEFPGEEGDRCVTASGEALDVLLPILAAGNQLTIFVDTDGTQAAPIVRVLVPGEPSPCPDEVAAN